MARNVEIKARVADLAAVERLARAIATEGPTEIRQDDTFFPCADGRLKLRELAPDQGQLIHYARADESGPKVSDYSIAATSSPGTLRDLLARALGSAGRVRKERRLYLVDRTRIHLDQVEGLGSFVELEVVLVDGESAEQGVEVAHRIMKSLGITESQLVRGAYVDLLAGSATRPG
jgi:predicted adenylyl cyclase CyaB